MRISKLLSDDRVLAEIGERVSRHRLDFQLTQAKVAEQAGVSKRTVERIEAGASTQMLSMIRVLRVLGLMPGLDRLVPEVGPKPMDLLKRKGRLRQRAPSQRRSDRSDERWSWGDDT